MSTPEKEVFGVIYERFSVGRKLSAFGEKHAIKTVLELPAHGSKAMPSIYSLGFGGCASEITLVNGNRNYLTEWEKIGAAHKVKWVEEEDVLHTSLPSSAYDFVWSFAYINTCQNPDQLLEEMKRLSKKYVAIFSVNAGNIGFPIHRMVHKKTGIPWTHGDIRYNNRKFIRQKMMEHGLKIVDAGFVDCPVWPDSLGFRDVRLHRMNKDFNTMEWESDYPQMLADNSFPAWVKAVYLVEKFPMPAFLKSLHSHLNYTIAEKEENHE